MRCSLCGFDPASVWSLEDKNYSFCSHCGFIQVFPEYFPSAELEKERYARHNNDTSNSGYMRYLKDFLDSAFYPYVQKGSKVLDFGSGPVPVLSNTLNSSGYRTVPYDPYFAPGTAWRRETFDAAVSVEVFEHLKDPAAEISNLLAILKKGGFLVLRTELHQGNRYFFESWWYRRDFTHISFYSEKTFRIIAKMFNLEIIGISKRCEIILSKTS